MKARQGFDYAMLALLWGSSFLVMHRTIIPFGWVGVVTFRAFIASGLLVLFALLTRRRLVFGAPWWRFAIVGATTVVGQLVFLAYAVQSIGTAMSAILVATIPLFSMIIGHFWRIETITALGRVGTGLGALGTVALVGFPAVPITSGFMLGCGAMVLSTLSAAIGSNYARLHLGAVSSFDSTIATFFFGGLIALPLLLLVPVPGPVGLSDVAWIVFLAASMSSLTYVLYFRLVAEVGATIAISVEFVVTTVAVVLGAVVLHEALTWVQVAGGAVIIAGCLLVLGLDPRALAAYGKRPPLE
ncbi:MAG: DMT family transporter [Marmoricola sp.]